MDDIGVIRDGVRRRALDRCEWPGCNEWGSELAHLHSRGMGGRPSADDAGNLMWACWDHARITDGEHGHGGASQYRRAHVALFGPAYLDMDPTRVAWERAEALRKVVAR